MPSQEIVLLEWWDSAVTSGVAWQNLKAEQKRHRKGKKETCWTAGFVLYEDEDVISVAASIHKEEVGPYITIPKVAIISRTGFSEEIE